MSFEVRDHLSTPLHRANVDIANFERAIANQSQWDECSTSTPVESSRSSCEPRSRIVQTAPLLSEVLSDAGMGRVGKVAESPQALENVDSLVSATRTKFPGQVLEGGSDAHVEVELVFYSSLTKRALSRVIADSRATLCELIECAPCKGGAWLLRVSDVDFTNETDGTLRGYRRDGISVKRFMESAAPKVSALRPQLGRPYFYVHNGDCEHHVVVTDVRAEQGAASCGVRTVWRAVPDIQGCGICGRREVRVSILGDFWAESSPMHYCLECLELRNRGLDLDSSVLNGNYRTSIVEHESVIGNLRAARVESEGNVE